MHLAANKQSIRPLSGRIIVICDQKSPEINSDWEALQMARKLLEYARYKGNEKLLLVLSKSTDLLQEIVIRNQKQSSIYDYFLRNVTNLYITTERGHVPRILSLLFYCYVFAFIKKLILKIVNETY